MRLTGAEIIVKVLLEQGVDSIFGYPGGAVLNIYDALYKNSDKITHYITAHEQGAAHAADGYARATGKTGVVLATSGPGATNLVTGIATAFMDSIPMVAITGNVANSLIGKDSFQEVYIAGIAMPVTKQTFVVRKVEKLAFTLREAFRLANSGRPGPVLVDIPKDVTSAVYEYEPQQPFSKKEYDCDEQHAKIAAQWINEAEKPVVYFGGGVKNAGCVQELRELVAKANIPATHTMMGAGVLKHDMPENLGMIGMHGCFTANKAVDEADLVIAVGTRFSDRVALNAEKFARRARVIHMDIDCSEMDKNVECDLHVIGDVKKALNYMLPLVEKNLHPKWMKQIMAWRMQDYCPVDDESV
ncbi:MAG: acetolactate synthase large subunit, partial [Lachnospiraceae bacterium]|nr:acetolactate synthase large subunit [Lachnospiraceae bacterium]